MHVHSFVPSHVADYEVCSTCGTYHSLKPEDPAKIYNVEYWSEKHHHSTMREQVYNIEEHKENGLSKAEFIENLIADRVPSKALEIGCAPGVMLRRLRKLGLEMTGVEFSQSMESEIRSIGEHTGELVFGPFPTVDLPRDHYNLVLAMDVFEHSFFPELFIWKCSDVLREGGKLALMVPLMGEGFNERMFHPAEHVFLFTEKWMREALENFGFKDAKFDRWCSGHETVVATKG